MSQTTASQRVYLARQPIYDRRQGVYAYELLYRSATGVGAGDVGREESAATLVRAISEIGLDRLVGEKPAFINIPPYLLTDPSIKLLPKERVVLEILETTNPDPAELEAAAHLQAEGYKLALDDFVYDTPQADFIPFCRFVKVDLVQNDRNQLPDIVQFLKKARVRTLAEKVETMQVYARCQSLGFDYFQGYYFSKPDLVSSRGVPAKRSSLLHVLARLQDPKITMDQMEQVVSTDVNLTYRLLRLVNSAFMALPEEVTSVRSALMRLGLHRVISMVSLLAMSGASEKSSELLIIAMVRAKMCESMALKAQANEPEAYFTVGLLSVLEAMFDTPMSEILEQLPLALPLREALSNPECPSQLARTLRLALSYESGLWSDLDGSDLDYGSTYLRALDWAEGVKQSMAA